MIINLKNAWKEKNIRSNFESVGFKNGRLNYKGKECKKSHTKLANESIKNFPTLYKFCNVDHSKFFLQLRKVFILINIWIAGKHLMKYNTTQKSFLQQIKFRKYHR